MEALGESFKHVSADFKCSSTYVNAALNLILWPICVYIMTLDQREWSKSTQAKRVNGVTNFRLRIDWAIIT